jgi:hypothetical protein
MAFAQTGVSDNRPASAQERQDAKTVVAELRRLIAAHYVVAERRSQIDAILAKGLASGRYDASEPGVIVQRVNEDLAAASNDKHLGIHFDPQQAAMINGRQSDMRAEGPEWERLAQIRNHGLSEMRVMDGNVRYLRLDGFVWTGPKSAEAYDAAMRFLKDGDAAIIDLRYNGGGSPEAVQYVTSHFMEANRPLVAFHMGGSGQVDRVSTLASVPAGRMVGKPLYVLTSGHSASAAEEFVGHVGGFRLGELVGETTAGAAYRNDHFNIGGGYVASISVGRPELASTGGDWEAKGFAPTIAVAPEKALDAAHLHALRRLAQSVAVTEKPLLEGRIALLQAQVEPVTPALPLAVYAGAYGERTISLENGRLFFERKGGPRSAMIAVGPNLFLLEANPGTQIEFKPVDGTVPSFDLKRPDGSHVSAQRTS